MGFALYSFRKYYDDACGTNSNEAFKNSRLHPPPPQSFAILMNRAARRGRRLVPPPGEFGRLSESDYYDFACMPHYVRT